MNMRDKLDKLAHGGEDPTQRDLALIADWGNEELEHAAPFHNREWCSCLYCRELRRRETTPESE